MHYYASHASQVGFRGVQRATAQVGGYVWFNYRLLALGNPTKITIHPYNATHILDPVVPLHFAFYTC